MRLVNDEMDGMVGWISDCCLVAVVVMLGKQQWQNFLDFVVAVAHRNYREQAFILRRTRNHQNLAQVGE